MSGSILYFSDVNETGYITIAYSIVVGDQWSCAWCASAIAVRDLSPWADLNANTVGVVLVAWNASERRLYVVSFDFQEML